MKRAKLFVRITGLGEAKAEGLIAVVVVGLWAAVATWLLSRWEEAIIIEIGKAVVSVVALFGSLLASSAQT